ncbi:MAG: hypothetical protein WDN66_01655 [Candidatus Saccharibacteria bacterium]
MLRTLKNKIIMIVATMTLAVPMLIPLGAEAACSTNVANGVGSGINATASSTNFDCGTGGSITSGVKGLAKKVVDIFSVIVGIISVIMIIYAGFRYITSGGESGSVSSAKNTLIYAIIGLFIVVIAQVIVHYVLNTASSVGSATGF